MTKATTFPSSRRAKSSVFVCFCVSIWGFFFSVSVGRRGGDEIGGKSKIKREKCVFLRFSLLSRKIKVSKCWIKPQRRQTDGDFSISCVKKPKEFIMKAEIPFLWAWKFKLLFILRLLSLRLCEHFGEISVY